MRNRRPNFVIFVAWIALIAAGWVVVKWSRKSCLGPAEIAPFVCLVLFKDGRRSWLAQDFIILFVILIKGMRRWGEFRISLRGLRDGKILIRTSTSC